MSDHEAKQATPHATLLAELLDSRIPKSEREHAAAAEIERLRAGLRAVSDLIDESHGVAGLHRNGDVAPWSDLRAGGKYEAWLVLFDDALKEQK